MCSGVYTLLLCSSTMRPGRESYLVRCILACYVLGSGLSTSYGGSLRDSGVMEGRAGLSLEPVSDSFGAVVLMDIVVC